MTRLIMVRHGETAWNANMRFQGQSDIELSTNGVGQARLTAARLAGEKIDVAYASDLCRCAETARIILDGRDVELHLCPELRELNFGDWEGLTAEQIAAHSPGIFEKMRSGVNWIKAPGGEAWADLEARVVEFLDGVLARHPHEPVLIVGHVNPIRVVLTKLLKAQPKDWLRILLYNCSVSIFETDASRAQLVVLNDFCHLEDKKL